MKFLRKFNEHTSYEAELNVVGIDFKIPNVSYCKDVKDVHFNPYNTVEFYVGEITEPQTVSIYTDATNHIDVTVNEGNKWYSYVLPKDKVLCKIEGNSVKKVVVKADISFEGTSPSSAKDKHIIPSSTVEASFKSSNTSNITGMLAMFGYCSGLTSLDLSGWDTSNVTIMFAMFAACSGLTSLDLSGWDTSNVTNMGGMFNNCASLTSLDLRIFNTSNVTNMNGMFKGCSGLTELNLSGWDTSKVNNMNYMFQNCSSLVSLDLSGWIINDMNYMPNMFDGCSKLKTITMKGCSEATVNKIKAVKPSSATTIVTE